MRDGGAPTHVVALTGAHVWRKEGALFSPREKMTADLTLGHVPACGLFFGCNAFLAWARRTRGASLHLV